MNHKAKEKVVNQLQMKLRQLKVLHSKPQKCKLSVPFRKMQVSLRFKKALK